MTFRCWPGQCSLGRHECDSVQSDSKERRLHQSGHGSVEPFGRGALRSAGRHNRHILPLVCQRADFSSASRLNLSRPCNPINVDPDALAKEDGPLTIVDLSPPETRAQWQAQIWQVKRTGTAFSHAAGITSTRGQNDFLAFCRLTRAPLQNYSLTLNFYENRLKPACLPGKEVKFD